MKQYHEWCPHSKYELWDAPLARGITHDLWSYVNWSIVYTTCPKCLPKYLDHVRMLKLKQDLLK